MTKLLDFLLIVTFYTIIPFLRFPPTCRKEKFAKFNKHVRRLELKCRKVKFAKSNKYVGGNLRKGIMV